MGIVALAIFWIFCASVLAPIRDARAGGDPIRGKRAFLKCVACHSAEPNVHKAGPSLAGIWGRRAGTAEGFDRYSEAMLSSGIIWDDETLQELLRKPRSFIPGTLMKIRGIASAAERQDIVAYLKQLGPAREQNRKLRSE